MNQQNKEQPGKVWVDPPGEWQEAYDLMDTSLINADANDKKKECEAKGGVWEDPPGECKEPTHQGVVKSS